jgi:membrane-bound serine protease (ClpP class)
MERGIRHEVDLGKSGSGVGPSRLDLRWIRLGLYLAVLALGLASRSAAARDVFVRIRVNGVINPIQARYVERAVARARAEEAELLLVTIDTPGGLVASMQQMVVALSNSAVPVVGYVAPRSAQASSAGAFVLLAADVAAMAPGTRVGAAHPVAEGKPLEGALDAKATNSLASLMASLAARRGRPSDAAVAMVRESLSYTAEEAQAKRLIEILASDQADLLRQLQGWEVRPGIHLATQHLVAIDVELSTFERVLDALADPTVTSLLLSLGTLAIIYELATAGIGASGAMGALMIVLGLYGGSVLPLEVSAIALLLIGVGALVLEIKLPTHGVLGAAGVLSLLFGSLLLVDPSQYFGGLERPHLLVLVLWIGGAALAFGLLGRVARRALGAAPQTGSEALIGKLGEARSRFGLRAPEARGQVLVDGARWQAETREELIEAGEAVEVIGMARAPLRLSVRRKQ